MRALALIFVVFLVACSENAAPPAGDGAADATRIPGFIDLLWNEADGQLLMEIDALGTDMLYQTSLPRGLGSNDIGLDRGQLGNTRIVRFERHGDRVLLVAPNMDYRANGDNAAERQAVAESFASSVLWGFPVESESGDAVTVDSTAFFLRDAHGVARRLKGRNEGTFSADDSRSAIYLPRTRGFPDNTEIEAIVTFTGEPTGQQLPTVVPDPRSFTLHLHHSFIRLPDDGYEPLAYDPRAGVIPLEYGGAGFSDYTTPIGEPLKVNYGIRHRLEKKDPSAEVSEAVEPIVYYLDPGAPEPVRSALVDGARWWNQAFEAAGYQDAFRVEMLPDDADPMDVRYNVIQWVHRSTRGWSYGASVVDPRTGEILKGHVTLGSLRVRQDYLIAEGLLAPYANDTIPPEMLEMSLARIRQLSAHEIGHTIGFEHNFAASTQDRSSVMDYPFPLIRLDTAGAIDLSDAYDDKIGSWDIRTVIYAYQDFPDGVDADAARADIMAETIAEGYRYVSDSDSRAIGTAHPDGNLWDNGEDAIAELEKLLEIRAVALQQFGEANLRSGRSLAKIEEVLVPIYLLHRFQIHAVGKLIGGSRFSYAMKGDGQGTPEAVEPGRQRQALVALVNTLDAETLALPESVASLIPPRPPGLPRDRETFRGSTGVTFDRLAPAAASTALTLEVLFDHRRAARLERAGGLGFATVVDAVLDATWYAAASTALERQTRMITLDALLRLAFHDAADDAVRAIALDSVLRLQDSLAQRRSADTTTRAHYRLAAHRIERALDDPSTVEALPMVAPPPGSPIGQGL
ncbi:MAG: zinc-dependent metalloprotease [Pseudomonadota bacterium]